MNFIYNKQILVFSIEVSALNKLNKYFDEPDGSVASTRNSTQIEAVQKTLQESMKNINIL